MNKSKVKKELDIAYMSGCDGEYYESEIAAQQIDALYSTVDGDLREKIAEQIAIGFYNKEVEESGSAINWKSYKYLYMKMAYPIADSILTLLTPYIDQLAKGRGYVKLAKKQIIPPFRDKNGTKSPEKMANDMLASNWVQQEGK